MTTPYISSYIAFNSANLISDINSPYYSLIYQFNDITNIYDLPTYIGYWQIENGYYNGTFVTAAAGIFDITLNLNITLSDNLSPLDEYAVFAYVFYNNNVIPIVNNFYYLSHTFFRPISGITSITTTGPTAVQFGIYLINRVTGSISLPVIGPSLIDVYRYQ